MLKMKLFLIYTILPVVMSTLIITSTWALPTPLPAESKHTATDPNPQDGLTTLTSVEAPAEPIKTHPATPDKPLKVQALPEQKRRNIMFRDPVNTNMVLVGPMSENHGVIPDYPESILAYRPLESFNYDYSPEMWPVPFESILEPEPVDNLRAAHVIVYPTEDINAGDMATAESNIVFRPLFSYRRQTAQKRKVYSRRSTASSTTPSYNRNEQRGSQGYPYRYPSYGYPNYYPSYYHNAQFDTVA